MNAINKSAKKAITALVLVESWTPALWGIGIAAFAVLARYELGYWPAPNHPDPQFLPFVSLYTVLFILGYPAIWSFPVLGLTWKVAPTLWARVRNPALLGWCLLGLLTLVPGIQFVPWFLD